MKKYFVFIVVGVSLFFLSSLQAKKVALLISTEDGAPLYTDKDIDTMKNLLGSSYEYILLYKKDATSTNIRDILIKLSGSLKPQDTFIFYYSGHGQRFENFASNEKDNKDDFLVTSDIECDDNQIANVIVDDELNYRLSHIKAQKVVIIDACHSQTMYKSFGSDKSRAKLYKGCSKNEFTRAFPKNPTFENATVSNMIFLGAAQENQSAEGSYEGGIFTLALAKALKENPNISFSELINEIKKNIKPIATRLQVEGAFVPSLSSSAINPSAVYTKNIFVVPNHRPQKEDFESYLSKHRGGVDIAIHRNQTIFTFDDRVVFKVKVANQKGFVYLVDILDQNNFTILEHKNIDDCITLKNSSKKQCQFTNIVASAPFGQSVIYAVVTNKALDTNPKAFEQRLRGVSFQTNKVSFEVYP